MTVSWQTSNTGTDAVTRSFTERVKVINPANGQTLVDQTVTYDPAVGGNILAGGSRPRSLVVTIPPPAGSPPEFVGKLSAAVVTAVAKPEIREKLLTLGLIPVGSTQQGLVEELAANTALWQPIVKATGYKIN